MAGDDILLAMDSRDLSEPRPRERPAWPATAAALAAGLALRLVALTAGTLELDESYTVIQSRHSLVDILRLAPTDPNPPLTSLCFHLWTSLFGTSELAWESFSVVFGVLTIYLVARLAARLFGPTAGAAAAWLLAVSPPHVVYSQQMRSYSLALAIAVWTAGALLRDLDAPTRASGAAWLAGSFLLVNTHYYGLLIVAGFFAAAFLVRRRSVPSLRRPLVQGAVLGLALVPTLVALYLQYTRYYSFDWIPKPSSSLGLELLRSFGGTVTSFPGTAAGSSALGLAALLVVAAGAGSVALWRARRAAAWVLWLWIAVPTLLALAVSALGRPFLHPRYTVLWLPPLVVLAAGGLARAGRWRLVAAVVLAPMLAATPLVDYYAVRYESADAKRAFAAIAAGYREGDVVLHLSKVSWAPAIYYHAEAGLKVEEYYLAGTPGSNVMRYWMAGERVEIALSELGAWRRVWIYRWPRLPAEFTALAERLPRIAAFHALKPRLVVVNPRRTLFLYELGGDGGGG